MELHSLVPADRKASTVIVGISPDTVEQMGKIAPKISARTRQEPGVTLLADPEASVINLYGLLNDEAAARGRKLPHPTTYVIDRHGVVRWKFTEVNYKVRPTNEMILRELEKLEK